MFAYNVPVHIMSHENIHLLFAKFGSTNMQYYCIKNKAKRKASHYRYPSWQWDWRVFKVTHGWRHRGRSLRSTTAFVDLVLRKLNLTLFAVWFLPAHYASAVLLWPGCVCPCYNSMVRQTSGQVELVFVMDAFFDYCSVLTSNSAFSIFAVLVVWFSHSRLYKMF